MFDSIRLSFNQKARFVVAFDSRNSFITNKRAEIFGLKLGVEFGKKFGIGISGHVLYASKSHFYKTYPVLTPEGKPGTIEAQLKMFYIAYYAEYIFHDSEHWKFSVPLQLGIGRSNYAYTYNNEREVADKHLIIVYEPIVNGEYKLFRWLSITAEIGYRIMLINNPAVKENFNSPTYSAGISISYSEVCKICFPGSKVSNWLDSNK